MCSQLESHYTEMSEAKEPSALSNLSADELDNQNQMDPVSKKNEQLIKVSKR